ncbi:MAG TPA: DNA/RNA non-specific endonuclease, partial [Paludibacter sp.]|nr:DNA/RNA non-specific endonuclease [Paludibacter sp.]
MKNKFLLSGILTVILFVFFQNGYSKSPYTGATNINLALGNPSNAVADTTMYENYLMEKPQYVLSYNNTKHIPNWVSWHVCLADLGTAKRVDCFRPDPALPKSWYHVSPKDYAGTGFDKGHQCPCGDRTSTALNDSATFFMSNMIPQAPNNNRITWEKLEAYSRTLVAQGNELYIICGVSGQGGTGSKSQASSIGKSVVVPAQTWKIIVVLPAKIQTVTDSTRVIAVLMPNTQSCSGKPWYNYRVSVDTLEQLTGYNFLSNVPPGIQKVI